MELVPVGRDLASLMCMESEYAGCHSPAFRNLRSFENDRQISARVSNYAGPEVL
jgi:hypothetical protein